MLYDYLYQTYGVNTPIFTCEIQYKDYSDSWLFTELNKLCGNGELARFEKGVYYIPTDTILGKSILPAEDVIEKRYIQNGNEIFGFYGGIGFMNRIGLSTQVVSCDTIYTNNESSRKRKVRVGSLDVILKKPRVYITNENANTLAFLELMTDIPEWYFSDEEKMETVVFYIKSKKIARDDIVKYIGEYPDKTSKKLIESELIFNAA
ncbi:MAG: hypothetical protein IJ648_02415 [Lachnospiraceae bacterium]|nr:hypothetical protein [Lachnospiraceae bacterium]